MCKLLPESWRLEEQRDSCCRASRMKRGLITDIALWTECYASLVAVLSTKHPNKAPQFMGYLRIIVRASRNFEGSVWATYDAAYRRQAANRRSFDWAVIDPTIYNEAFTGRAKLLQRYRYCLSDTHEARECSYTPRENPPQAKRPRRARGEWKSAIPSAKTGQEYDKELWRSVIFSTPHRAAGAHSNGAISPMCVPSADATRTRHQSVIRAATVLPHVGEQVAPSDRGRRTNHDGARSDEGMHRRRTGAELRAQPCMVKLRLLCTSIHIIIYTCN